MAPRWTISCVVAKVRKVRGPPVGIASKVVGWTRRRKTVSVLVCGVTTGWFRYVDGFRRYLRYKVARAITSVWCLWYEVGVEVVWSIAVEERVVVESPLSYQLANKLPESIKNV